MKGFSIVRQTRFGGIEALGMGLDEKAVKAVVSNKSGGSDELMDGVADILDCLGLIDQAQNRPDEARAHLEEALQIYKQLANKNPDRYLPGVAASLKDLGTLDQSQSRRGQAKVHLSGSVRIFRPWP